VHNLRPGKLPESIWMETRAGATQQTFGSALKLNPNVAFSVQSRWLQMAIDTAAAGMDPLSFATPDGQCRRSRATSCVSFRMCRFTGQPDLVIDHRSLTLINAVG
jgi:hypothetical protein